MALSKEEQERYKKRWTNRNNNAGTATGTGDSGTTGSNASGLSESEKNRYAERWNSRHDLDQTYLDTFFNDASEFLNRVQTDYNKLDYNSATAASSLDYYKSLRQTESDLSTRAQKVQSYINTRKDKMDEEEYKNLSSYLSNFTSPQFSQKFFDARDYYSKWDSEDTYNADVAAWEDYEGKKTADLGKLKWELEELEEYQGLDRWYKTNRSVNADDQQVNEMLARYRDLQSKYGEFDENLISEKTAYYNNASRIQKGVELASVVDTDPGFSQYAGYVDSDKMPVIPDYEDLIYGTINGSQDAKNGRTMATAWSKLSDPEKDRLNATQYMSDEEKALYNYYYNKHGYDAAEEYLDSIIDGLNYIRGEEMFQSLKGNTVAEMLFGIGAGFDQANSGLQSLFSGKDYIPTSSTQYASGMVREDLAGSKVGQVAYDLITTGANMAPSILTSIAVGVINPAAGALAGNAMMGASAAGNAYASMINSGYDKDSASLYAASIGASEVVLGQLIGGISKLGGITPALEKALSGIDNGIARFALEYGGKMVSEGIEEGLQEILDPILKNAILHADEDIDWGEVAYSALLGGLSAGVMEGPGTVVGAVTDAKLNKNAVKQYGEFTGDLIQEGLLSDPSSESYQLAQKFQKQTESGKAMTGRQIRQQVQANEAQFAVEDYNAAVNTAKERLSELGETKDIENISKLVAKKATGQQLTRVEKSTLARSDYGAKVAKDMTTSAQQINGNNKAYNATYKSITERVGEEPHFGVSDSGQTTVRGENDAVAVAEVSKIEDGQLTVKLEDGREVYAGDIDFADDTESRLYTAVANMENITPAAATALVKNFDTTGEQSVTDYVNGIDEAYTYGYYGYAEADLKAGNFTPNLTSEQMMSAYHLGKSAKKIGIESNNAQIVKMRTAAEVDISKKETTTKKGLTGSDAEVYFMDGKASRKFDESGKYDDKRMAGVNYAKFLSKLGIGSKYYFYESYIKDGKRVYKDANGNEVNAPNGFYKTNDGSIYIDLNAGDKGDGFTLYTLGHELTHFIKQWSADKFQVLADFLIEEYGKTDMSMHQRVLEKQSQLEKTRGEEVSYDEAFEEVVADAMSTMLSDGNLHEKLAKLKAQDKGLFNKIKKFFEQLVAKFKKVYAELTPDQKDAQDVQQMKDAFDRIQTAFAEALVEASENFQASLTPGVESIVTNETGDPVAYSTEDGSVMLSMRTYEENGRTELRKYLDKCVSSNQLTKAEMQEMIDGIEEIYNICKEFKDKYAPFSSWSDAAVVRDTHGRPVFSVVTPNGDYKMNLDFSLVCKKRRTLDAVFNEMSKRGIIDDFELGQKSVVKINEIIRRYGLETACALCFVDAKRFRQASMADSFTSLYNELVMSLVPEDKRSSIGHFNFAGYETIKAVENGIHTWKASDLDFSHLDYVMKNYASGTVEHKAAKYIKANAEGRKLLLRGDFMSSQGFDAVKIQNQSILKLYNAKKGTGGPKAAFGDVQYLNEIVKKARTWTPAKAYEVGGVRIQSFSDYVPRMVFDYVQMIYDLAATKLPAHAYTKEALFVKQFGLTGVKINMSLIPAIADGGIAPGLDAKGNYVWAGESFDFETAKQIQNAEGYSENCGTICVGVSDLHIRKLLNDPNIRMVIPYHKSGLNPIVAHMNKIAAFNDYTNDQRTKGADGKALEKDFDFNKALHDMGANGDPKAVVQQYLNWCDENGYTAKFSQFRDHSNYYKLLEDFTVYDKDGNYVPQREVRAVFPKDGAAFGSMKELIESGLEEDAIVEGKRDSSLSSIVDEIQRTLPKTEAEISEEQVAQADHDLEGVKRSERTNPYSYETLTSKPDMTVTTVDGNVPNNRADVVYQAKQNAAKVGKLDPKTGSVSVHVKDIGVDVVIGTPGLKHGLEARRAENAIVTVKAGEILSNSIRINELTPKKADAKSSYVLIGTAQGNDGSFYIVRSVVNSFSNVLASMDVLYAINAKKGNRLRSMRPGFQGPVTDSTITIAELLDIVNQYFPDVLPESVLKHYGHDARPDGLLGTDALYSERTGDSVSNRNLLANAFEGIVQNSIEYEMLQDYKDRIKALNKLEAKLSDLNREIRKIRFTEGEYDAKKLRELESEAKKVSQEINRHDWKLLNLEASEPLRRVIDRERKKEAQKTRDHVKEIQQNKKDRAEQTEFRQKIRKKVRDLDKLLNRGNKKLNVKEDMKGFVSKALELADYLFTDHVSNDELIRKGITVRMTQREAALVKETEEILSKIYDHADSITDEEFTRLDAKRKANEDKLRDLLTAQRNERLQTPVYNLFSDLVTEYSAFKNSSQDAVKAAYNPEVERFLRTYVGDEDSDRAKTLKNMRVADMTTEELWKLDNAYQMVLHAVRTANKLFVKGNTESIEQVVTQIVMDFGSRKIPEKKMAIAMQKLGNKIGWDYEKLYYALDRIGSKAFTDLIMNLANSENIVMQDVMEAAAFRDRMVEKYGFNNWDVNKEIDREFLDHTGKKFKLTLGQLMSLYAYSRREGAWDHIEYGGFVFGEAALTNPKPADSFKLSKEQCEAITGTLTKEQKSYVEDMQKFLSETMGGKGNEVSMMLYGIKMFGEKNYFPIHIAGQFKAQAQESQAKQAAGFGSMSNAGFTHAQNPQAKAPFVLEGFNDVWSDHVNEMSRYHGTVPALEDLRRVMNRSSYSENTAESTSVKVIMENHYGKEAVEYFDNLYREANSGAITDKLQHTSKKLLSLFRKNSVAYSLSVLVQQPASLVRAYAVIDRKYFGFKGVGAITSGVAKAVSSKWNKAYENAYNEMMKYAPGVTMTKEIGGFDTATGGSIRSYLLDTDKSFKQKWKTGTAKEKGKAVLDVVDDNAIANLPNVADKIAWIEIWNACKRETLAKHKDLAPTSDEFMKIVGDRFTEVIRATQVYDSIFAKSPMLKSKNLAVQMLVSFMNEPNTVANMAESAVRDFTKGNRMEGAKKVHVLVHSIIFTGVLKSLIYAMRDDDEDETYIEKYIESLTGSLMDDFNLLNYIPIARDVWSVAQGYDVERADMAIVADAISALNKVIKTATTDRDGMTEDELVELDKKLTEASWTLAESLAAFVGIPMKNIRREINAMIDHAKIASANAGKTTAMSTWDTISDAVIDSIPFMGGKSKTDKLYAAIMEGDTEYINRLKATYKTDDSYHTAVRKALRENDPRIKEAAQAHINGDPSKRVSIAKQIIADGFILDDVVAAINSEINAMTTSDSGSDTKKEKGVYTSADIAIEAANGDWSTVRDIKDDIIRTAQKNGKTKDEAESAFESSVQSEAKEAYMAGSLNDAAAKKLLVEYAGKDEEEATSKVRYWAFSKEHSEYKDVFNEANVNKYYEFAEPAGISVDVYAQFINGTKGLADIKDEWGDVVKSKREQVLEVIDSLPITWQQKDALYLAAGYAESKIWDVPW